MKSVQDGNTQQVWTAIKAITGQSLHRPNVCRLDITFPDLAANAGKTLKIGDDTVNGSDDAGVEIILIPGQTQPYGPFDSNDISLVTKYVRASANLCVIYFATQVF